MPSTNYAYVNGRFVPEDEATVSIFDRGFLYGDGVFETMRVYGGRIFRALEHLDRLYNGLAALAMETIFTSEEFRAVCRVLIERNRVTDGVARIYVTRDSTVVTVRTGVLKTVPLSAIVSTVHVDAHLSQYKTANRLPYILAQLQAKNEGTDEAVVLNGAGHVVEFATSNLFVVKDEELLTPPLSDGPLPGITRHAVIALAEEARLPVREKSFGPEFLETADEVFATNSLIEIALVTSWGNSSRMTERLCEAYRRLVREELGL
jgi:branched-chain amino acid aminotransferase